MSDLIDRQAAIDEIDEWIKAFRENGHKESAADACLIQDGIIQLPSVQPERKKGTWVYGEDEYGIDGYHCDKCGFFVPWDYTHTFINYIEDYHFCPNCGADMRGEEHEDIPMEYYENGGI